MRQLRSTLIHQTHLFGLGGDADADDEVLLFALPTTPGTLALNPMTAAADLVVGGAAGVPTRLAMGGALAHLRVNAGATGLEWATTGDVARAIATGVDLKALTGHTATLADNPAHYFVPTRVLISATALTAAVGDAEITIGTTVGGVDLLPATAVTGLTALRKSVIVLIIDDVPAIAGNATLYITVTKADGGTALVATVTVEGTMVA